MIDCKVTTEVITQGYRAEIVIVSISLSIEAITLQLIYVNSNSKLSSLIFSNFLYFGRLLFVSVRALNFRNMAMKK